MTKYFFEQQNSQTGTSFDLTVLRSWSCLFMLPVLLVVFATGCEQGSKTQLAQGEKQSTGPGPSLKAPSLPNTSLPSSGEPKDASEKSSTAAGGPPSDSGDEPRNEMPKSTESVSADSTATMEKGGAGESAVTTPVRPTAGSTVAPSSTASLSLQVDSEANETGKVSEPSQTSEDKGAILEAVAAASINASDNASEKTDRGSSKLATDSERSAGTPLTVATEAEKNQKIASDWPKPWAALFLTGQQKGYIEPCGCTGLENQKGGLNRRDTLLKLIQNRGWDVVPLDAGSQVRRQGRQAELIFRFSAEAMAEMGYRAIALGEQDLLLSSAELLQITASEGNQRTAFTSSNVSIVDPSLMNPWQVIEIQQRKIGVTSVLGKTKKPDIASGEILIEDPVTSLQKAMAELREQKCDYYILLAHANLSESAELARTVPGFDLVVTAGGEGEPTYLPEPIEGTKSLMVQVGVKGMYVGLVGLYDDVNNPVRYQRIALSSQFEDSPRMMDAFRDYQEQLKKQGFQRLEVVPASHPTGRKFVGTESCAECHTTAFDIWKDTPHAHATQSIINPGERSDIARHFDPECLSCHVTGWNPQKFYPYESGYLSVEKTPLMMENGCENCHGPGSEHVAAENGDIEADETLLKQLREEMRLPLAQAQEKCLECHDIDNSPNFHRDGAFEEFWEQVKHYGKD